MYFSNRSGGLFSVPITGKTCGKFQGGGGALVPESSEPFYAGSSPTGNVERVLVLASSVQFFFNGAVPRLH